MANMILASLGWRYPPAWLQDPGYALYTLVALGVWRFGAPMVTFLAGIRQIPREFYDAARVDGAGRGVAVLPPHAAPAHAADPLQFHPADGLCVPDFHARLHRQRRQWQPGGQHAFLHALSVQRGLRQPSHGIQRGHGLDPPSRHRAFNGGRLRHLALLGLLHGIPKGDPGSLKAVRLRLINFGTIPALVLILHPLIL